MSSLKRARYSEETCECRLPPQRRTEDKCRLQVSIDSRSAVCRPCHERASRASRRCARRRPQANLWPSLLSPPCNALPAGTDALKCRLLLPRFLRRQDGQQSAELNSVIRDVRVRPLCRDALRPIFESEHPQLNIRAGLIDHGKDE